MDRCYSIKIVYDPATFQAKQESIFSRVDTYGHYSGHVINFGWEKLLNVSLLRSGYKSLDFLLAILIEFARLKSHACSFE